VASLGRAGYAAAAVLRAGGTLGGASASATVAYYYGTAAAVGAGAAVAGGTAVAGGAATNVLTPAERVQAIKNSLDMATQRVAAQEAIVRGLEARKIAIIMEERSKGDALNLGRIYGISEALQGAYNHRSDLLNEVDKLQGIYTVSSHAVMTGGDIDAAIRGLIEWQQNPGKAPLPPAFK
jgi:hypothetical protein